MKIAIDARMISWTGIGRYTQRLLEQLQLLDTTNEYLVLLGTKDFDRWQPTASNFTKIRANFEPYSFAGLFRFGPFLKGLRVDLVHFTSQNTPFFYHGRHISTVHDLTLIDYKNVRGSKLAYELKYRLFRIMIANTITRSDALISPTNYGKSELVRRYHLIENKINVTNEAADKLSAESASLDRFKLTGPFLLYVGNCYPYKNLTRLVEAFADVARHNMKLRLVLVGKDDVFFAPVKRCIVELGLQDRVIQTGYVTDGELVALYQAATMFVFPSLAEGFGLPPLEAMAQGTPVVSSNASCMPEILGEAAAYFDPNDTDNMAQKILALLSNKNELEHLHKAGPIQATRYSWSKMAQETLAVYQSTLCK